ncbi:MAG: MerR family transcriptional regulator [Rhizobiales bacterium]|nr:MerR family transcriptional regulator [Hyphomicrobiales bacterium]MDQ3559208.1 MerR family transcriptional regulator [Pseudomonadota bacterium]
MKAPDAFRTISEVAEELDLPQHVLRFWETRFNQIKPMKRGGGRRYYRLDDVQLLRGIRLLLYAEGFTIRGVQRLLKEKGVAFVAAVGQTGSIQTLTAAERDVETDPDAAEPPDTVPEPLRDDDRGVISFGSAPSETMPAAADHARSTPARPGLFGIPTEGLRRLDAALADLLEAKRLLDQAR